jgi:hypothetical protein
MRGYQEPGGGRDRAGQVAAALRLVWVSVAFGIGSGAVSVSAGLASRSLSVLAVGLGVLADVTGSAVLVWRFRAERRDRERSRTAEVCAAGVVAAALAVVAAVITAEAAVALAAGSRPGGSGMALIAAAVSLAVLTPLAHAKRRLGAQMASRALQGDGTLSGIGAATSLLAIAALLLNHVLSWWWADQAAALIIAVTAAGQAWHTAPRRRPPPLRPGSAAIIAAAGRWLPGAAARAAGPRAAPFVNGPARDRQPDHAVKPPGAPQGIGGQAGEHRDRQVGAQQVLRSLPGGGGRSESGADPPLGHAERWLEHRGTRGQGQAGDAGLGPFASCQSPDGLGGDIGGEQEETDRDQLLGPPLGSRAGQPGAGEPPDDDDARHRLDAAVQPEPEQGNRPGHHRRADRDPALDAHPGQGEPGQDPGRPGQAQPAGRPGDRPGALQLGGGLG